MKFFKFARYEDFIQPIKGLFYMPLVTVFSLTEYYIASIVDAQGSTTDGDSSETVVRRMDAGAFFKQKRIWRRWWNEK